MPNVGALLKEEITRLSRKEIRKQLSTLKKASAQYRRYIAGLRRQVERLERQVSRLQGRAADASPAAARASNPDGSRFVAKGLHSHRLRVGLSAEAYGRLAGVSGQTIYNWERKASSPRAAQRAALATLRRLGKRAAHARLAELSGRSAKGRSKA